MSVPPLPSSTPAAAGKQRGFSWLSLIGPLLLVLLLWGVDFAALAGVVQQADWRWLVLAMLLNLPMVLCKSVRWQVLMQAQQIRYATWPAYLAYFGSIFIGLLTPGRLGEFVKALHVKRDCQVSGGRALSSVLADRLFDLSLLLSVGALGFASASFARIGGWLALVLLLLALATPLVLLLHQGSYAWLGRLAQRWLPTDSPRLGPKLARLGGIVGDMRQGLQGLSWRALLLACGLTLLAYGVFFSQCYLVAQAVGLTLGFVSMSYAVALGSLITLLPISISGIGTRDAAIVAYLGTFGVVPALALAFSLLVFVTFHLGGALLGAGAWLLKPAPLDALRSAADG